MEQVELIKKDGIRSLLPECSSGMKYCLSSHLEELGQELTLVVRVNRYWGSLAKALRCYSESGDHLLHLLMIDFLRTLWDTTPRYSLFLFFLPLLLSFSQPYIEATWIPVNQLVKI